MTIHASAIVDPGAQLGSGVEVGPYAVIGRDVIVGDNTVVQAHSIIDGVVQIGRENVIGFGAVIGAPPQDLSFKPSTRSSVVVGDRNTIREYCTIHRGTAEGSSTTVGNDNFFMVGVHLGHNCAVRNNVIIANDSMLGGYVQIGDRAFIGGNCVFHQFMRVGRLAITQGMSGYSKDIPPFLIGAGVNTVAGLNVVGLRRAGFSLAERNEVKRAFNLLYKSGLNTRQALERAANESSPLMREFFDFIAQAGKRGIVPYRSAPNESAETE
ncbi:MAG TPA: acyl-ACP--UDP-N-acetylglucosamine O-acyltransferase [Chthoniobacterales bacterium]